MPKLASSVINGWEDRQVVIGENQPEYQPLHALRHKSGGYVTCRWTFSREERELIAAGYDVFVSLHNAGGPTQPHRVLILDPDMTSTKKYGEEISRNLQKHAEEVLLGTETK